MHSRLLLTVAAALLAGAAHAGEPTAGLAASSADRPASRAQAMTLQDAMALAARRPQVRAELDRARAARHGATAQSRGTWMPSLTVDATAARRDTLGEIDTPAGAFTIGERDVWDATIALRQPILNWAEQAHRVPGARDTADAAGLRAARSARVSAAQAGYRYLDVLTLDAEQAAVDALLTSLDERVARVQRLARAGRALDADVLDVRLARDRAEQSRIRLAARRTAALADLGRLTGQPSIPLLVDPAQPITVADNRDAASAVSRRRDLLALDARIRAADRERAAVAAEALPTLGGSVAYLASRGTGIQPEEDTRVGVSLQWTPFAGGSRLARRDAATAERDALVQTRAEAAAGVRAELASARADHDSAVALEGVAASAVAAARATLDTRSARFGAGRATIDEVLDAEARLAEQDALARTARLARLRAAIALRLAAGLPLLPDRAPPSDSDPQ